MRNTRTRQTVCFATLLAFLALAFYPSLTQAQSDDGKAQIDRINGLIQQNWADYELRPSKEASEGEWCRRVHLDIIGRIPTVDELQAFLTSPSKDKKRELVEQLLYADEYTEEYARNWTTIWTNLLIGRTGGNDNDSMISREGMQKYLRDTFARNKPYDKMVHELVTATGTTTPGSEKFNGAVNFLIDKVNEEDAAQATAATTKTFLGLQVQCTQCHNHPFNDWKQQKYWEMNAFFRQVRAFRGGMNRGDMSAPAELRDQDFAGESGNIEEADLFYDLRNGLVKVAYPVFVDGTSIKQSGYVKVVNRRKELADLMMESPYLAQTLANRMWGHFMGYGFTKPVDDLGPHNIPTNPELLEYLGQEIRSAEFDVRKLITWITLSRPYSLSSERTKANEKDDPLMGESPKFTHFYLRQMRAEELYESLLAVSGSGSQGSYEEQERKKNMWLRQFSSAFGTDEGDETTSFNGTIPQVLMMFNGDMIKSATSEEKGGAIDRLVKDSKVKENKKVEHLFLAGLSRKPSRDEMKMATTMLSLRNGNVHQALKDVWWVILNTNEFIFNH